jgi:hypothetical protein
MRDKVEAKVKVEAESGSGSESGKGTSKGPLFVLCSRSSFLVLMFYCSKKLNIDS